MNDIFTYKIRRVKKCMESALVTASSHGLGKAIALVFAESNYDIILHGRDLNKISEAREELFKKCPSVSAVKGDLRGYTTINELYDRARSKELSILINNAAIPCAGLPFEQLSEEYIEDNILTNLLSVIKLTRKIYPIFLERGGGTIININSSVGLEPRKYRSVHSASKWGLRGFDNVLRLEAREKNIRVISVYPGRIKTVPEFDEGMEMGYVAERIYEAYKNMSEGGELLLEGEREIKRGRKFEYEKNGLIRRV